MLFLFYLRNIFHKEEGQKRGEGDKDLVSKLVSQVSANEELHAWCQGLEEKLSLLMKKVEGESMSALLWHLCFNPPP
jgi:hypothetical protein